MLLKRMVSRPSRARCRPAACLDILVECTCDEAHVSLVRSLGLGTRCSCHRFNRTRLGCTIRLPERAWTSCQTLEGARMSMGKATCPCSLLGSPNTLPGQPKEMRWLERGIWKSRVVRESASKTTNWFLSKSLHAIRFCVGLKFPELAQPVERRSREELTEPSSGLTVIDHSILGALLLQAIMSPFFDAIPQSPG